MIKIRSIYYMPDPGANGYLDCSARNNAMASAQSAVQSAKANLDAAKTKMDDCKQKLDNAKELLDNIKKEQESINEMIGSYDSVYDSLAQAGTTFLTESNLEGLNCGASCLANYKNALTEGRVAAAQDNAQCNMDYNQAVTEHTQAQAKYTDAQAQMSSASAIPCVWVSTQ